MFAQQKTILQTAPALRTLVARYPSWHPETAHWLEQACDKAQDFTVPVPLVGAFSAGKSSIVNAVIGTSLLSANIDPETAVPAEVRYAPEERLMGCFEDGRSIPLTRDEIQNNDLGALKDGGWVLAQLPAENLRPIPHITLVDMPGWDSGINAHGRAIDAYSYRSLAYGVVVSAEEGSLRDNIRLALHELAVLEKPVFVVITKADKKPADEVASVARQVEAEIKSVLGAPPTHTAIVSARKKDVSALLLALQDIENSAQGLFDSSVVRPLLSQLQGLSAHINILRNSDDLESEQIQADCSKLETEMQIFRARLNEETAHLNTRVAPAIKRIGDRIKSSLTSQLELLTSDAIANKSLEAPIGAAVRIAVQEGMRDDFIPEVTAYIDRVNDSLPESFNTSHGTYDLSGSTKGSTEVTPTGGPSFSQVLSTVLLTIPKLNPLIGAAIVAVTALAEALLGNHAAQQAIQRQKEEQKENVKTRILHQVIPQVASEACYKLEPQLHEMIREAKRELNEKSEAKHASIADALAVLQRQLAQNQAERAKACQQYDQDSQQLAQLIEQLAV